jgi:phage shock protein PspC (stress-responsive transcriptional regulator)
MTEEEATMDETARPCPYCAENISDTAVRCPYCRSRIYLRDPKGWHRAHAGRKLAGVCLALAQALALPVTPIRLAFVLATLFHFTGAIAYVALWLLIPREPGHEPILVQAYSWASEAARRLFHKSPPGDGGSTPVSRVP